MIKYPIYTGRKGSKCYFTYDATFFNDNMQKCCELIAFHTLYLFGKQETIDDVLLVSKNQIRTISLEQCMRYLFKDQLKHRIFHLAEDDDKKLLNFYNKKYFMTNDLLRHQQIDVCEANRIHDEYPCMKDTFKVKTMIGTHVLANDDDDDDNYLVLDQISDWEYDCEPHADKDECELCDNFNRKTDCIDDEKFIFKANPIEYLNKCNYTEEDFKKFQQKYKYDKELIMNNLIFNFRDHQFDITIKNNKATVIFNESAVGGYRHASLYSGAVFEVQHAIPGTLKHYKTSYVNTINITFMENDDDMIIISEYKAIDVL